LEFCNLVTLADNWHKRTNSSYFSTWKIWDILTIWLKIAIMNSGSQHLWWQTGESWKDVMWASNI